MKTIKDLRIEFLNSQKFETISLLDAFAFHRSQGGVRYSEIAHVLNPEDWEENVDWMQHQFCIQKYQSGESDTPFDLDKSEAPIEQMCQNLDTTSANSLRHGAPVNAVSLMWDDQQDLLFYDHKLEMEAGEPLPDHTAVTNLKTKPAFEAAGWSDRYIYEVLQPTYRNGQEVLRPVQIISKQVGEKQPLNQWLKCKMAETNVLTEIYDDLKLPFDSQRAITQYLQDRPDRRVPPAEFDLSGLKWAEPESVHQRAIILAERSFGQRDFNWNSSQWKQYRAVEKSFIPTASLSRPALFEAFISKRFEAALDAYRLSFKKLSVKVVKAMSADAGFKIWSCKEDAVELLCSKFKQTQEWQDQVGFMQIEFAAIFENHTLSAETLREQFIAPMNEELHQKFLLNGKAVQYELDNAKSYSATIEDLIDIKTSDLKALDLKIESEIELREALLNWRSTARIIPEDMMDCEPELVLKDQDGNVINDNGEIIEEAPVVTEQESLVSFTEPEDINPDDMDSSDYELESDERPKKAPSDLAFTYSACAGDIKPAQRPCSLNDAFAIQATMRCRDAAVLERIAAYHHTKYDGGWATWNRIQDAVEYAMSKI